MPTYNNPALGGKGLPPRQIICAAVFWKTIQPAVDVMR